MIAATENNWYRGASGSPSGAYGNAVMLGGAYGLIGGGTDIKRGLYFQA
ncbi:MAG: hypothetical protein WD872_20355 [Pirellulaceae bacterium]